MSMAATDLKDCQPEFELGLPTLTESEERAATLLTAYPRLHLWIEKNIANANGDRLEIQPQVTKAYRFPEDDRDVLDALKNLTLSESESYVVHAIWSMLPSGLRGYAHRDRVVRWLSEVRPDTIEKRDIVIGFVAMLQEKINVENSVKLMELERLAEWRWREIEAARDRLPFLYDIQDSVSEGLRRLEEGYEREYETVKLMYLAPIPWKLLEAKWNISERAIAYRRTQALSKFAGLCDWFDSLRLDVLKDPKKHKRGPK